MALRGSKLVRTFNELCKSSKYIVVIRNTSLWTPEGVIKSPYKDVVVPDCTLPEYMWKNLEKWAQKPALVCALTGKTYTFEQAHRTSRNFAANLRKKFKIKDGDTVIIMLPNLPEYPIVTLGVLQAGGVASTINPIYTAHEVQRQLIMSEAKLIITLPQITNVINEALKLAKLDLPVIAVKGNDTLPEDVANFFELIEDTDTSCLKDVRRTNTDVCFLPYSSGTTGLPKGVELTHQSLLANCEQMNEPMIKVHNETTASYQDSILAVLPFFHIYAATVLMFHKMAHGIKIVALPKFQPDTYLDVLEKHRINVLLAAPPLIILMGNHPAVTSEKLQYLDTIVNGAAPLSKADAERLLGRIKQEVRFSQGYGLTETSPVVSISDKYSKRYDLVGHACPNTELKIVDADMKALGPNETGELLVRGPQVMKGYKDNPKANAETLIGDGWFRTGDMGIVNEEGVLKIVDRLKELIKVKGFQVPPAELEAVLREHPAVTDAAVIGVPHPTKGESPKAFICMKSGHTEDVKNIAKFVEERVAPYKKIDDIVILDAIPKSAAGKILRKELRKKYC
ncbi:4-coumarate--CoA ligase 1-like [Aricia agestis]|uniref:4-coumarate--CoA ligase 1-like n=1 Tax=Aricia agestis TaxID=91739 RepID=UPI001C204285|nr:4-coumarate--CoA ligase 1-like [Aricia agestis]